MPVNYIYGPGSYYNDRSGFYPYGNPVIENRRMPRNIYGIDRRPSPYVNYPGYPGYMPRGPRLRPVMYFPHSMGPHSPYGAPPPPPPPSSSPPPPPRKKRFNRFV